MTPPRARLAWSVCIAWLATAFILIIYPAWQVVLFWIFAAFAIDAIVQRVDRIKQADNIFKRVVLPLLLSAILVVVFMAICILPVLDVYQTVQATVYPGQRSSTGGGWISFLMNGLTGLLGSINASAQNYNACESAGFFALTPLGCIVGLCYLVFYKHKNGNLDWLILLLSLFEIYAIFFAVVGVPTIVAKLTLFSHSQPRRVLQVVGYADFIITLVASTRFSQCVYKENSPNAALPSGAHCQQTRTKLLPSWKCTVISLGITLLVMVLYVALGNHIRITFTLYLFGTVFLGTNALLSFTCYDSSTKLVLLSLVIALAGATVNPIQQGISQITDNSVYKLVSEVAASDADAIWATDSPRTGQMCIMAGAKTVNSINTYPVLERWAKLDGSAEAKDIYNRYAHITIEISNETVFASGTAGDTFYLKSTLEGLKTIGVKYFLSTSDNLTSFNTPEASAALVAQNGSYYVWEIS